MNNLSYLLVTSLLLLGAGPREGSNGAEQAQGNSALQSQDGKAFTKKGHVELVPIPAGEFIMGGPRDDEKPQRKVYMDAYLIGKTPVTVGQFKAFCAETGFNMSKLKKPFWGWIDSHPMVNVNWQQAREFCKWAGGDLPTEAQWEKAARGTDGREYPWGCNFDRKLFRSSVNEEGEARSTAPVGSYPAGASPFGCLDMIGNVWQICLDCYSESYVSMSNRNPVGPRNGPAVVRGGSWYDVAPDFFRAASRHTDVLDNYDSNRGFRLRISI